MASIEKQIIDALSAITQFKAVQYLVAGADDVEQPEELPWAVLLDGGRDFEFFATMCGNDTAVQAFDLTILSISASETRSLTTQAIQALVGLAVVIATVDSYNADLNAYQCNIELSA